MAPMLLRNRVSHIFWNVSNIGIHTENVTEK